MTAVPEPPPVEPAGPMTDVQREAWQQWNTATRQAQRVGRWLTDAFGRRDYPGSDDQWAQLVAWETRLRAYAETGRGWLATVEPDDPPPRIPSQMRGRRLDDLDRRPGQEEAATAIAQWCSRWHVIPRPRMRGMLLVGPVGVGKTSLACALAYEAGLPGAYWSARDIAQARSDEIGSGGPSRLARTLSETPLLIVDDLGAGRQHDYVLEVVREIVERRYDASRPVVVTTNLSPQAQRMLLGERTESRLAAGCDECVITGDDQRQLEPTT